MIEVTTVNIFDNGFLEMLRESIVSIVQSAVDSMAAKQAPEVRYLQKKDARKYIGGIDHKDFNKLVSMGLPEIQVGRSIRYDKKDIDVFMAKHKL